MAKSRGKITIILAFRNSESTLQAALESLERQKGKGLVAEILAMDNKSTDSSARIVRAFAKKSAYRVRHVLNKKDIGLAGSFNRAITMSKSEYVILMHSDVVIEGSDAFAKALAPFADRKAVVAYPVTAQPLEVWKKFNFWQKCFFRKYAGVDSHGILSKFDCYKKKLLIEKVGLFDNVNHRTAGEDTDMDIRIRQAGLKAVPSGVRVIHLHSQDASFSLPKLVQKESQYAEATGAVFARYGIGWLSDKKYALKVAARPLLIIGLVIPYVQYVALALLLAYSILVTRKIYQSERNDVRIFLLPLVNIAVLFFYTFYMLRGLITGKQRL